MRLLFLISGLALHTKNVARPDPLAPASDILEVLREGRRRG
jgi:hypothetical protein